MKHRKVLKQLNTFGDALKTFLVGYCMYFPLVSTQGDFPKLENIGAFKPVTATPTDSTCGTPGRSVFCASDTDYKSIQTCSQLLCIQDCPHRSKTPTYQELLQPVFNNCVNKDGSDLHPMSKRNATSFIFYDHKDCFVSSPMWRTGISFTLTVWMKLEQEGEMCLIEKSADGQIVFKLTISEKETTFYYRTTNGLQAPVKVMTQGRFLVKKWIHLSVQVHQTMISFFINGMEEDGSAFASRLLIDPIFDTDTSSITIGQSINGLEKFVGRMQDFRMYQTALSNREIVEDYSGEFPCLHIQSDCRCPVSHPRLHPSLQRFCIPNGAYNATGTKILRLNADAHPLSYINDNDLETFWISSLLPSLANDNGITVTLDFDGQYQVFYVILQFYSAMPQALKIQRKKSRSSEWEDWQYFAKDCIFFGMENNGVLKYPDSINCQQLPKYTPFSRGNVTFSIFTPEPKPRPGYKDFYNTQNLQEFVKAFQMRFQMIGLYYWEDSNAYTPNSWHNYYGISEITISGRCHCNGHAEVCDRSVTPYRCLCNMNSHTDGNNCDRCLPLFNDKAFRQGDQVSANNCRRCQCNNHSFTCHYDATQDLYPNDHYRGGGGVCDNCLHNTTAEGNLSAIDVCKPCRCNKAGTISEDIPCEQIGGQCKCKTHVVGLQCDQCMDGYYNLNMSDYHGCQPCKCNSSGTRNGYITCHQYSGQCKCKPNFTGLHCDRCNLGFKQQNILGMQSCVPCDCNIYGSTNQFCNPISGQCKCREDVKGDLCNRCTDNHYGLDAYGCKECDCYSEGTIPGTICDAVTGQCTCRTNVGGRQCNECLNGYFKSSQTGSLSCLPCECDVSGTMTSPQICDKLTGQCFCKPFVSGQQCSICMPHMYNLSISNLLGCQDCDCDPLGTLIGTMCDPVSGQCKCLPHFQGRRCSQCNPGYYLSNNRDVRCVPCSCHHKGAYNETCSNENGQCYCHDLSITGQRCDQCRDLFFGFDPQMGRCQPCRCHLAGAINGSCDSLTGHCYCKVFVMGFQCSKCTENASGLEMQNPFGCSKTPDQQPPPIGHVPNSTSIALTWNPPDSPNTNRINYVLYRDGVEIYRVMDYFPYSAQSFVDNFLLPYTSYSYHIEAGSVHGSTASATVVFRTRVGIPVGNIQVYHFNNADPFSVTINWTLTSTESGPIEMYRLMYTTADLTEPNVIYEGLNTSVTLYNVLPFTRYHFSLHACTAEGCLQSSPMTVVTPQTPPSNQNPPFVTHSSSTSLSLKWNPPSQANGK
ncbi:hypothetical protein GDO86_009077 [Hymenochirus boettgeri]|uniref:Usherin n=1 Tax=Hymenochirus boettgeri TaxID=247094 RepID=A0A8T2JJA8_9PIPI|nr:hypothetical protein GDO86_009077 [Hymenochirus boettgeri]